MRHLSRDLLLTIAEGGEVGASAARHASECARCREEALSLGRVIRDVRAVEVPEPSPLFWTHLPRRVRACIDAETAVSGAGRRWPAGPWWAATAWLASATALLLALLVTAEPGGQQTAEPTLAGDAPVWQAVLDAASRSDEIPDASDSLVVPASAERAVLELSADEDIELARLLQQELRRPAL